MMVVPEAVVVDVVEAVDEVVGSGVDTVEAVVVTVAKRGFKRLPPPTKLCSGRILGDLLAIDLLEAVDVVAVVDPEDVVAGVDVGPAAAFFTSISRG